MSAGSFFVKGLGATRLTLGGFVWIAPRRAAAVFEMDPERNVAGPYLARLFAVRDAGLGAGLLASPAAARRVWWPINIASDAFDIAAMLAAHRRGELSDAGLRLNLIGAVLALSLGLGGALTERSIRAEPRQAPAASGSPEATPDESRLAAA